MQRAFNFSAGPAALPDAVLEQARAELLDYQGQGFSVLEMSHRSKEFLAIAETAEADLRELLAIGDDYHVLFLQGGASMQFAQLPMNLCRADDTVDYIHTGAWGSKAIAEAKQLVNVNIAASSADASFTRIPPPDTWRLTPNAAYCHIVSNETIGGVQFHDIPAPPAPLVADMSSELLSRVIDIEQFGVVYAGAQKNIGPARPMCGDHPQATRRPRAARHASDSRLRGAGQETARCSIRHPPTFGTWRGWCCAG